MEDYNKYYIQEFKGGFYIIEYKNYDFSTLDVYGMIIFIKYKYGKFNDIYLDDNLSFEYKQHVSDYYNNTLFKSDFFEECLEFINIKVNTDKYNL